MYQFRSQRTSLDEPGRHKYLCPNDQVVLCTFSLWQASVIGIKGMHLDELRFALLPLTAVVVQQDLKAS
jgi:hypothetical protein